MKKTIAITFLTACFTTACATSMSPKEFSTKFPKATNSRALTQVQADEAVEAGDCVLRGKHKYRSDALFTAAQEMRDAAEGVDEWVEADKANAYTVTNYEWIETDSGESQLVVEFNTLRCG